MKKVILIFSLLLSINLLAEQYYQSEKIRYRTKWTLIYKNSNGNNVIKTLKRTEIKVPQTQCKIKLLPITELESRGKINCLDDSKVVRCKHSLREFNSGEKGVHNKVVFKNIVLICESRRFLTMSERRKRELKFELNNKTPY